LKRKINFSLNLQELGFAKLKDLVLSMSEQVSLELRGHNHPFAFLIEKSIDPRKNVFSQDLDSKSGAFKYLVNTAA
jgi:hypothetical protein